MTLTLLGQVVVNGLCLSAIYILIALGFTLLFGIMRVVNFAHGEFAMLGAYALYYLYGKLALPWVVAVLASAAVVAFGSLVLERVVFRWFYQKTFQSMIGTMGLSMAIMYLSVILWDAYERSIPPAFTGILNFGNVIIPIDRMVVVQIALVTLAAFYTFMRFSKYGLAMRAAAQDLEMAEVQGITALSMYRLAFVIAIAMTAMAGALYGQLYAVSPFMGERPVMMAFIVVVLGGMGSIPGAALSGVIIGFIESVLGTFYSASAATFVSFGAVILILIFRPWGLMGRPE